MTYSQDLRERVMSEVEKGEETHAEIAERFMIHEATLDKWWFRLKTTGSCAARPQVGGPDRTLEPCETFIRAELKRQPDATLAELCEWVLATQKISASTSMMSRELKLLHLSRKKSRSRTASGKPRA
jgi:transposase